MMRLFVLIEEVKSQIETIMCQIKKKLIECVRDEFNVIISTGNIIHLHQQQQVNTRTYICHNLFNLRTAFAPNTKSQFSFVSLDDSDAFISYQTGTEQTKLSLQRSRTALQKKNYSRLEKNKRERQYATYLVYMQLCVHMYRTVNVLYNERAF